VLAVVSELPQIGAEPRRSGACGPDDMPDGISQAKILFLALDGVRYDKLLEANTPHLDALAAHGQLGPSYIQDSAIAPTLSGPGHTTMLTGVWADKHRVTDNTFGGNAIADYPDFLTRVKEADPGFSTYSTLDWAPLNQHLIGWPDVKLQQTGPTEEATDQQSTDDTVKALTNRNPDVVYVYFHAVDEAGHVYGHTSPEYVAAIEFVDERIGELVAAVRSRPSYDDEDWLVLATTDHGMNGRSHGGDSPGEREIWILAAGGDVPSTGAAQREWRLVDLVPTVLEHLGIAIDPAWGLDGIAIGERSTDPFDRVRRWLRGDEGEKPAYAAGWTNRPPSRWSIEEHTPEDSGVAEYRGWSFRSGELWASGPEGQGRGSFVRARDVIAVADPVRWAGEGAPAASALWFDSTLWSPWHPVADGDQVRVSYLSHYRQVADADQPQHAELVAQYGDNRRKVLWSADSAAGTLFDISRPMELTMTARTYSTRVRIGWHLAGGDNGYWAIHAPAISVVRR